MVGRRTELGPVEAGDLLHQALVLCSGGDAVFRNTLTDTRASSETVLLGVLISQPEPQMAELVGDYPPVELGRNWAICIPNRPRPDPSQ